MTASEQLTNETELIVALRRGEEAAFVLLIDQYHTSLVRIAQLYVPSRAVAEEVAQETWMGVLQGIDRFEGRSSLKTWIFRILTNRARTRGERESRSIPFADLATVTDEPYEGAVDPSAFLPEGHEYAGWWASPPQSWQGAPEERLLAGETREQIAAAIAALPSNQRSVITLRDVEGWSAEEVVTLLGVSDANQRVLLHRARAKVRRELERYLSDEAAEL